MSLIKFELKEEHLKLMKYLKWGTIDNGLIVSTNEKLNTRDEVFNYNAFNDTNVYEDVDLILNGKPPNYTPLDIPNEENVYSAEQKTEWDKLLSELPIAIEIVLSLRTFEVGTYIARWHERVWNKINL